MDAVAETEDGSDVEDAADGSKDNHSPAACGQIPAKEQNAIRKAIREAMLLPSHGAVYSVPAVDPLQIASVEDFFKTSRVN